MPYMYGQYFEYPRPQTLPDIRPGEDVFAANFRKVREPALRMIRQQGSSGYSNYMLADRHRQTQLLLHGVSGNFRKEWNGVGFDVFDMTTGELVHRIDSDAGWVNSLEDVAFVALSLGVGYGVGHLVGVLAVEAGVAAATGEVVAAAGYYIGGIAGELYIGYEIGQESQTAATVFGYGSTVGYYAGFLTAAADLPSRAAEAIWEDLEAGEEYAYQLLLRFHNGLVDAVADLSGSVFWMLQ